MRRNAHMMSGMPEIDPAALRLAMDRACVTPTQLARAVKVSLTYIGDMTSGRRRLARNPQLRADIATALGVPREWIEAAAQIDGAA